MVLDNSLSGEWRTRRGSVRHWTMSHSHAKNGGYD